MKSLESYALSFVLALSCAGGIAVLSPTVAVAQGDGDSASAAQEAERPDPPLRRSVYDAGRWSLGIDGVFSRTSTNAEFLGDEGQANDTTRFFRVDPWVTVGVIDHLHVGAIVGFISRRLAHEGTDASSDNAFAVQPLAQYLVRMTPRLGAYGQLAPGMYLGRSERTIPGEDDDEDVITEETTNTMGFVLTVGAGVNYRLSEGLQLRFGLTFNGLWGRESVEATNETLSSSTTHLGMTTGLRYTF